MRRSNASLSTDRAREHHRASSASACDVVIIIIIIIIILSTVTSSRIIHRRRATTPTRHVARATDVGFPNRRLRRLVRDDARERCARVRIFVRASRVVAVRSRRSSRPRRRRRLGRGVRVSRGVHDRAARARR